MATGVACPKPVRGSSILKRAEDRAERIRLEREAIAKSKQFHNYTCRWPESHVCRGGLEGAHVEDKSTGGENVPENIVCLCAWIHRRGPESIHGKQLKVECLDPLLGTKGPMSFWRQTDQFDALGKSVYYEVAREDAPFVIQRGEH